VSFLDYFAGRSVTELGLRLADAVSQKLAARSASRPNRATPDHQGAMLEDLLTQPGKEPKLSPLNFYQRAKISNAFRVRLLENNVDAALVNDLTGQFVLHLSTHGGILAADPPTMPALPERAAALDDQSGRSDANDLLSRGAFAEAAAAYRRLLERAPEDAEILNNLGAALLNLGQSKEAEQCLLRAIEADPQSAPAHCNLSIVLRLRGLLAESEAAARRALQIKAKDPDSLYSLGTTLLMLGRLNEAKAHFAQVLKLAPRYTGAMVALSEIAKIKGRFEDAETMLKRALHINANLPNALASLVTLRKMTPSDASWLDRAEALLAAKITPQDEAALRFAVGKFCDDVGDYERAFKNYQRGNEILKGFAPPYDGRAYARFVDTSIREYPPGRFPSERAASPPTQHASASGKPVFVVGMPRSGTSLVEQIIASHPQAAGAGELNFWAIAYNEHGETDQKRLIDPSTREKLAADYLQRLSANSPDALRVVDKAPVNSDFLGLIHSILPNSRIIYLQRDPIDICLSCYFHALTSPQNNFTMDLSDLANYFRTHRKLVAHWRAVLPAGTLLEVPYEELVADPAGWSRKIIEFIGLEWNQRCLKFYETKREVATASSWQVRQKIFTGSVKRWRRYEKFITPLLELQHPEA
jgi:tetratricopeptide (TPR) repeat protein